MEHEGKNNYFRDVHIFVNRMRNLIIIKSDKLVKNNLYICFKSNKFYWWNSVFSSEQKRLIKFGIKIEKWEQTFMKRWKKSICTVMITIKINQYTMAMLAATQINKICINYHQSYEKNEYAGIQLNNFHSFRYQIQIPPRFIQTIGKHYYKCISPGIKIYIYIWWGII